jgi:hypothetical protein
MAGGGGFDGEVKVTGCDEGMVDVEKGPREDDGVDIVSGSAAAELVERLKVEVVVGGVGPGGE